MRKTEQLFSISGLANVCSLDRRTVAKRLAGLEPVRIEGRSRLYRLKDALPPLIVTTDNDLGAAKLKRARADAGRAELKLGRESAEVVDVDEARDYLNALTEAVFVRFDTLAVEIVGTLRTCKTRAEIAKVLQAEVGKIFSELREDHTKFLTGGARADSRKESDNRPRPAPRKGRRKDT